MSNAQQAEKTRSSKKSDGEVVPINPVDTLDDLMSVVESLQQNIFVCDTRLNMVYINPEGMATLESLADPIKRAFNVSVEDIRNGNIHRFHRDPERVEAILRNPASMPHRAEFNFDNVTLRSRINAVYNKNREIIGYTVCWNDITSERKQENEIRRVMNMVEQMPTAVFLCNVNLEITYLNPAARQTIDTLEPYLKVSAEEILGKNIDIFHKDPSYQRRILADPDALPHRARITIGPEKLDLVVTAIYDGSGDYVGPMLTWEIVTQKAKIEAETRARVSETVDILASSSEELVATSDRMSEDADTTSRDARSATESAEQISNNVEAVSSGVEEMSASIREIARNANDAAKVADDAVSIAESTNGTISTLGERSSEIGEVVKTITSIAQQTNLLALNATIEAARAGDAGRGFAVVANEVKELARETSRATEDIGKRIDAIQTGVSDAVNGIGKISEVIHKINEVQGSIASAVEEQTITTNDIASRIGEAASGTNEVAGSISGVATVAESTRSGVDSMRQAARELGELATSLQKLMDESMGVQDDQG